MCRAFCAVFYSVLRENARCFILCDTLLNCTPIGESNYIFLSLFKLIFPLNSDSVFLSPYRCANQKCFKQYARCFILLKILVLVIINHYGLNEEGCYELSVSLECSVTGETQDYTYL